MSQGDSRTPIKQAVHKALRAWRDVEAHSDSLLDVLFLVRKRRQEHSERLNTSTLRMITNQVLLEGVEELAKKDAQAASILRARFLNDQTILKVSLDMNISVDQLNRLQRKAIDALADLLQNMDLQLYRSQIRYLEGQLQPVTYTNLYGIQESLNTLVEKLQRPAAPWLIAIVGLGGIGKTTLADAAVRQIIQDLRFDQVIWLRANPEISRNTRNNPSRAFEDLTSELAEKLFEGGKPIQNRLSNIRQTLKNAPHLIVIDNLESETDTQYLFDHLSDWGKPSKILITSRTHPPNQTGVFTLSLGELSLSSALELIRHQADINGLNELATASDEALEPVWVAVGGNPFALKLVVSLAKVLPIDEILKDIPIGHARPIEEMYRHIYWKAWQILSKSARALLLVMPLVANIGAKLDQMEAISGLPNSELLDAIQELANRSLLETRGSVWDRRYGIHRLTESFLRTEIIHWNEEPI